MYINHYLKFSRFKRTQPRWHFPERRYALWEMREWRVPQPDWDFQPRPVIREFYRPKPVQPTSIRELYLSFAERLN
jgi:hypothetical protein